MPRPNLRLSAEAAARLAALLAEIAATPGIGPAHRYEVTYCRDQVRQRLPAIEGLIIAGLLHEAPHRLVLDRAAQAECRWWAAELVHALSGSPCLLSRLPLSSRSATADNPGATTPADLRRSSGHDRLPW